jgi:hypothetical protein
LISFGGDHARVSYELIQHEGDLVGFDRQISIRFRIDVELQPTGGKQEVEARRNACRC